MRLGGRAKGTPNRKTAELSILIDEFLERPENADAIHPVEYLVRIASGKDPQATHEERTDVAKTLLLYLHPKRAMKHEISGPDGGMLTLKALMGAVPPDE